jgi:hypothetical protein
MKDKQKASQTPLTRIAGMSHEDLDSVKDWTTTVRAFVSNTSG